MRTTPGLVTPELARALADPITRSRLVLAWLVRKKREHVAALRWRVEARQRRLKGDHDEPDDGALI
jgi:hypothetical protein